MQSDAHRDENKQNEGNERKQINQKKCNIKKSKHSKINHKQKFKNDENQKYEFSTLEKHIHN